jgi:3-dehydroquinate synthase
MKTKPLDSGSFLHRVVLAGMMGSGKSTVGKLIAEHLGWEFVDTDSVIEERTGNSIQEIFEQHGEAHFRTLEKELARELQSKNYCVVATGGRMIIPHENRNLLSKDSLVVHLNASIETLMQRLEDTSKRPLLGKNREATLQKIYVERKSIYEGLPVQVTTDGKPANRIVQEILIQLVKTHNVLYSGEYHVHSGYNLVSVLADLMKESNLASPIVILADEQLWNLCGSWWLRELESHTGGKFEFIKILLPGDESTKSTDTVVALWEQLIEKELQRSSSMIVLGGGVLGDVGGFVASTLLRGIPLFQVPTTLLAQIDAAIGGKTGINVKSTKNMVGSFYPANHTLIDPLFLLTQSQREFSCGLAEMIKAAVLADADFFEFLEDYVSTLMRRRLDVLLAAVEGAARIKLEIVAEDLLDRTGRRALLNLGHTLGHALESVSEFDLRHGEAVAIGMVLATRLAVKLGHCEPSVLKRLISLLEYAGLPTTVPEYPIEPILAKVKLDKKRLHHVLQFVIPTEIGQAKLLPIKYHELRLAFEE